MRQLRVIAGAGGRDDQPAADHDGARGHRRARGDLGGHRLSGHHAGVDRRLAELDHAVGGDRLARAGPRTGRPVAAARPAPAARCRPRPARRRPSPRPRPAPASHPRRRGGPAPHTTGPPAGTWSPTRRPPGRSRRQRRGSAAATRSILAGPASRTNIAYTDQPQAATMPSDTSVSIDAEPCRAFFSAAAWNGHAAHPATGAASATSTHCQPAKPERREQRQLHRQVAQRHEEHQRHDQPAPQVGDPGRVRPGAAGCRLTLGRQSAAPVRRRSQPAPPPQ